MHPVKGSVHHQPHPSLVRGLLPYGKGGVRIQTLPGVRILIFVWLNILDEWRTNILRNGRPKK